MNQYEEVNLLGSENGNGHQKAFVLAKPKTPEEIARENLRRSMPEIRRAVNQMRLAASSKWLFAALSDDSFLFDFGGDGFGTIITTIKDLSARYNHDRESLATWLSHLDDKGVVWCEFKWPYLEIHLSHVVPPPKHKGSAAQRIRARLNARKASLRRCVESTDTPVFDPAKGKTARETEEIRKSARDVSPGCVEPTRLTCGTYPHDVRKPSTRKGGHLPHDKRNLSTRQAEPTRTTGGNLPHDPPAKTGTLDAESSTAPAKTAVLENLQKSGDLENSLNVQRLERSSEKGMERLKRKDGETGFLEEVSRVLTLYSPPYAKQELENSGAWWRLQFRKDADKAWRIVGEIKNMILTRRIRQNPGAAAVDLWNRLP